MARQQTGYNFPSFTSFYFASDMDWKQVPVPAQPATPAAPIIRDRGGYRDDEIVIPEDPSFDYYIDGTPTASGTWQVASGDHRVAAVQKPWVRPADGAVTAWTETADTTRPDVTLNPLPTSTLEANQSAITVAATDDVGLDIVVGNIYRDGKLYRSTRSKARAANEFAHTIDLAALGTSGLPVGSYMLRYNARDLSGNVSATREFAFTVVDTTKPHATLTSPPSAGPFRALSIRVEATDVVGLQRVVASVYRDGKLIKSTQTAANGARHAVHEATVNLGPGTYTIRYNAQDLAGNISATGTFEANVKK